MVNKIPSALPDLIGAAEVIRGAAEEHGATIPLVVNTAENIGEDADALTTARNNHEAGKVVLATARQVLLSIVLSVRLFLTLGRDLMKQHYGSKFSPAYTILGFVRDLAIPDSPEKLLAMLQAYKAFYTANPQYENVGSNITAARAQALYDQLAAARTNCNVQQSAVQGLLELRNTAMATMRTRISGLIAELKMRLSPLDARWTAFGLNKPGAKQIPVVPEGLTAVLIGNNAIALRWTKAPRADHYRIYAKINGVNEELIPIGSRADLDFTIEGLPAATKVELAISAVNNGGESQRSEIVTVTTS